MLSGENEFCLNVREISENFTISSLYEMIRNRKWLGQF